MAYLDSRRRTSSTSLAGVIAVHAVIGIGLIAGLTVTGTIIKPPRTGPMIDFPLTPPPPPPPEPQPSQTAQTQPQQDAVVVPDPVNGLSIKDPVFDTTTLIKPSVPDPLPSFTPTPRPSATGIGFKPIGASPRNNPASWVGTSDYQSEWARREWTGRASFRLAISAEGGVTGCTITSSTGHTALDNATCALVAKRARFEPARGADGEAVAGSYAGTIVWQLPD